MRAYIATFVFGAFASLNSCARGDLSEGEVASESMIPSAQMTFQQLPPSLQQNVIALMRAPGTTVVDTATDGTVGQRYIVKIDPPGPALLSFNQIRGRANAVLQQYGGERVHVFASTVQGFSAILTADAVARIQTNPEYTVYPVEWAQIFNVQPNPPSWGLDRIDADVGLDSKYSYDATGAGVNVYILDSGIRTTHEEFAGTAGTRAVLGKDILQLGDGSDQNGHGTHVAATIGGSLFGVAKGVRLISVRVASDSDYVPWDDFIAGVEWVINNVKRPAVLNVSIGGYKYELADLAVQKAVRAGITVVAAAGNVSFDACRISPAREPAVIAVAATTSDDYLATFSNIGECVDMLAPGDKILSAWNDDNQARAEDSGTSMAAPHVAGAAALYLEKNPQARPADVRNWLLSNASRGKIGGITDATPNLLLRVGPL